MSNEIIVKTDLPLSYLQPPCKTSVVLHYLLLAPQLFYLPVIFLVKQQARNYTSVIVHLRGCFMTGHRLIRSGARGSTGGVASLPRSGKNFMPVGAFTTENCILMYRKIPSILLCSPLSGNPAPLSCKSWHDP